MLGGHCLIMLMLRNYLIMMIMLNYLIMIMLRNCVIMLGGHCLIMIIMIMLGGHCLVMLTDHFSLIMLTADLPILHCSSPSPHTSISTPTCRIMLVNVIETCSCFGLSKSELLCGCL
jgi:hypothetical protein